MKNILATICSKGLPPRDIKNANRVNLMALLWVITLGVTSWVSQYEWFSLPWVTGLAFTVHSLVGVIMVFSFKHFLSELDEMEKKIQLDALALAVGVTLICFSSYSILSISGVVPELTPSYLIILMALTYMAGIISGRIRYR